ncbi:hypothetical protein BaRGS_00023710 [Batillaria attramentaria]|uniref:Uncharacterized protein n=1 Tax=Batillaria attramentaria TaxID=370345 RepID=A0ABD0KDA7_9CAEN
MYVVVARLCAQVSWADNADSASLPPVTPPDSRFRKKLTQRAITLHSQGRKLLSSVDLWLNTMMNEGSSSDDSGDFVGASVGQTCRCRLL